MKIQKKKNLGGGERSGGGGGTLSPVKSSMPLTLILSEILHLQCLKYQKKGNNSKIIKKNFSKISPNTSLIIPFQLTQVSSFYL